MTKLFRTPSGGSYAFTFILVSSLFLLWGFCNGMIDVMDKHFQDELHLTLAQSAWVQFAHYLGYFLMALPAGWIASKVGYKGGIISGLLLVGVGGFWFLPATSIAAFWAFLLGVCLIAAGLTFLETIANPYTTVLGPPEFGATRINLAQSCNGIGWIFGPIAGRQFFYGTDAAGKSTGSQTLWIPYVAVAVVVVLLAVVFYFANVPDIKSSDKEPEPAAKPEPASADNESIGAFLLDDGLWKHKHFTFAVVAQFFYVAAQSGIFSFFINYMTSQTPAVDAANESWLSTLLTTIGKDGARHISDGGAATLASVGFFCFLSGRFSGSLLLRYIPAHKVLGVYGLLNVLVCGLIFAKLGWVSVIGVFASYFFMSIMFPTIFALGIYGLGAKAKKASSFIVMAIIGGALLPKVMGHIGDLYDISRAFIVPLACFLIVGAFGFMWPKLSGSSDANVAFNKGH